MGLEQGASDIILAPNCLPALKIDGEIIYLDGFSVFSKESLDNEILSIMTKSQREDFLKNLEFDFSIDLKGYSRFRVNVFFQKDGFSVVFRPIKVDIPEFDDLGVPKQVLDFVTKKSGLILVTGSVGSGKSTTLASLVNYINKNQKKHIVTIEDPIEFVYKNEQSLIEQREVGENTISFDNALKYSLRQATDVIMLGEMRDLETFRLALRAAETGNLVLATLHTSGAARTISRIIDMFPQGEKEQIKQQLSESLIGVVWQTLEKKKSGKGRVLATEVLVNTTSVSNTIRRGLTHQIDGLIETGGGDGMITMKKTLERLKKANII
ncbi:type IV pili twitching motility protein PilT [Candidatus Gracilibacteria bacterium]|nr:MAG: type IV pili twitching motility protein PilT [Candidatus Gracilibacteria bacterium]